MYYMYCTRHKIHACVQVLEAKYHTMVALQLTITIWSCLSIAFCCAADGINFSYDNQSAWRYLQGSESCGGRRQSPIDIITSRTTTDANLRRLERRGWNGTVSGKLTNTGRTVKFTPDDSSVTVTHLGEYTLRQFHLHWGNRTGVGSEHLVNGRAFDGELHFVHARTSPPANANDGDANTVIAVFLRSSSTSAAGTVWEDFVDIPRFLQSRNVTGIVYDNLLPTNLSYYYYNGSLTTPPCSEAVQWVVLQNPISIPAEVLQRLRQTPASYGNGSARNLTENYRNVQPLNGRSVYRFNSAASCTQVVLIVVVCLIVAISLVLF